MRSRTSVCRCVTVCALVAAERRTKKEQGFWPCSSLFSVLTPVLLVAETGAAAGERAEDFFPPKTWTAAGARSYDAGILPSHGRAQPNACFRACHEFFLLSGLNNDRSIEDDNRAIPRRDGDDDGPDSGPGERDTADVPH